MAKATLEECFWAKVEASHPLSCWWWTGQQNAAGYGKFGFGRQGFYVHRLAYELLIGLIPPGLQIDHLCQNKLCCNPDHLQVVSQAENMQRSWPARKRFCVKGHALTPANTNINPHNGTRHCLVCKEAGRARRNAECRSCGWVGERVRPDQTARPCPKCGGLVTARRIPRAGAQQVLARMTP